MEVEDIITGRGGAHELVAHFPLHPDVEIIQYSTDYAVLQSGKRTIEISFTGNGKLLISPFNYCPQFGVNIETQQLLYKVFGQLPVTIKTTIDW